MGQVLVEDLPWDVALGKVGVWLPDALATKYSIESGSE